MSILTWLVAKLTGEALKTGGEVAKTAVEIPKTVAETRKAHLEIAELQLKKEEREKLITPATFADVERFDPKIKKIREWEQMSKASSYAPGHIHHRTIPSRPRWFGIVAILLLAGFGSVIFWILWGLYTFVTHLRR